MTKKNKIQALLLSGSVLVATGFSFVVYNKHFYKADVGDTGESQVENLTTNWQDYESQGSTEQLPQIPKYEKLELTFDLNWYAGRDFDNPAAKYDPINDGTINPYWPYDPDPSVNQYWAEQTASLPQWESTKSYSPGDHIQHNGKHYALIKKYLKWNVGESYKKNDIVVHEGNAYIMNWRNYWDQVTASDGTLITNSQDAWHYLIGTGVVIPANSPTSGYICSGGSASGGIYEGPLWSPYTGSYNLGTEPGVDGANWQEYWEEYTKTPVLAGVGVSVDGYFTGPDGQEITPASSGFYYQDYKANPGSTESTILPRVVDGKPVWKIRFTPRQVGNYSFRIVVTDKSGFTNYFSSQNFTVIDSDKRGFVRVSPKDNRYFETTTSGNEGEYLNVVSLNAAGDIGALPDKGINLIRPWWAGGGDKGVFGISGQGGFSGSGWHGEWGGSACGESYCDPKITGLKDNVKPGSLFSFRIDKDPVSAKSAIGVGNFGIQPDKDYKVSLTLKTSSDFSSSGAATDGFYLNTSIPAVNGSVKLLGDYLQAPVSDWTKYEYDFHSYPTQYTIGLSMITNNITSGSVFIDSVSVKEVQVDGSLSSEIITYPSLDVYKSFPQYKLFYNDTLLAEAEDNNVYESIVLEEKEDIIYARIQADGTAGEFSNNNLYGSENHASRAYQKYYWRYFIARYGYSTNIFNVEFCNEGDPYNGNHTSALQALTKYFQDYDPYDHLVTTSNWHSFPVTEMWSQVSNLGLAQVHQYVKNDGKMPYYDTAELSKKFGELYGARQTSLNVPTVVGETGLSKFSSLATGSGEESLLDFDDEGIWFKKLVWGQINSYGTIVQYWWNENIDKYNLYKYSKAYSNFIGGLNLTSGKYNDSGATTSDENLRAWGQKEVDPTSQKADKAHLWIDNKPYNWKAVVDNSFTLEDIAWSSSTQYSKDNYAYYDGKIYKSVQGSNLNQIPQVGDWWSEISLSDYLKTLDMTSLNSPLPLPVSGTITIPEMEASKTFNLEWWDTSKATDQIITSGLPTTANSDEDGNLNIAVSGLVSDIALKITVSDIKKIDQPSTVLNRSFTYKSVYMISGTKSAEITSLIINGSSLNVFPNETSWTAEVNLPVGENTITIIGKNDSGEESEPLTLVLNRRKMADANNDSLINVSDFALLLSNWNLTSEEMAADFNEDNKVNVSDFSLLLNNWGK